MLRTLIAAVSVLFSIAACPPNCFSCNTDNACLGPDGRSWAATGSYDRFCKDGFYGSTCSSTCPRNCAQAYCSASGYCMATPTRTPLSDYASCGSYDRASFCKDGFFGSACTGTCPGKCAQPYCSASGYCMATPLRTPLSDYDSCGSYDRALFCKDGFFGSACTGNCPANCAQAFCSASGYCMATPLRTPKSDYASAGSYDRAIWCKDGSYGSACTSSCPGNCVQPYCSASGYCMATSIRTPKSDYDSCGSYDRASFCKDGFFGSSCTSKCPATCAQPWCSASGYCMACPTRVVPMGDYDASGSYDRAHFCKDGFYGSGCGGTCPGNCAQAWCSTSGYCLAEADRVPKGDYDSSGSYDPAIFCRGGFYGSSCTSSCPSSCAGACSASGYCQIVPSPTPVNPYPRLNCPQPTPVPAACTTIGQCSWYNACLQGSTGDACPDIANVMQEKCNEYLTLEPSLSAIGQQWSSYVRSCLQRQLSTLWKANNFGLVSCDQIDSEFFDNHLPCYLDGPVSFCDLPTADATQVIRHAGSILVSADHWWSALSSGAQLEAHCVASFFQVNVVPKFSLAAQRRLFAGGIDVEASLRRHFQATFSPQGWSPDVITIDGSSFGLGFLPNSSAPSLLVPLFVANALVAWSQSPAGSPYEVSINDGPPLNRTSV